jgi:negative regulator of flagellin synthesis FlgM
MRIEAYNQVQQLYNNNSTKQLKKETNKSFLDQLQISSVGKDIQVAKQAVANASDIRQDLVASVKSRIDDGSYNVDAESFAEKLFARYSAI